MVIKKVEFIIYHHKICNAIVKNFFIYYFCLITMIRMCLGTSYS